MAKTDKTVKNRKKFSGPFKKGDPRINRNGRPPGSFSIVEEIKRQLQEIANEDPKKRKKFELLVSKIIVKAINDGDTSMIKDLIDRVDGKPKQTIENLNDTEINKALDIIKNGIGKPDKTI